MEPPQSWQLLTASLAVCNLQRPFSVWAFLVLQGLVRDEPGDREAFARFLREEQQRGEITGPSIASRVAGALITAGIALPAGLIDDPWGALAAQRLEAVAAWGGSELTGQQLSNLKRWRQLHGQQAYRSHDAGKKPWWKFW